MLLKFTDSDMLNTSLIDVATNSRAYEIKTVLIPKEALDLPVFTSSINTDSTDSSASLSSTLSSQQKRKRSRSPTPSGEPVERRRTTIKDGFGNVIATIMWNGRRPEITIRDEKIGALTDLFGTSTVRFMPKVLAIPTRFDTEYVWTATADCLTLFDFDTETVKGTFHQNTLRVPTGTSKKASPLSPSKSSPSLAYVEKQLSSVFIPAHLPGLGSNYLEFSSHPLANDIEIVVSFLMMEILRRGRFNLTPYTFEQPTKGWQFKESFMQRLRRNTI